MAFPSSASTASSSLAPGRAEALGLDLARGLSILHEALGRSLDEPARPADVHARMLLRRPSDLVEQVAVDPPAMAWPVVRPLPRQGDANVGLVVAVELREWPDDWPG